MSYSVDYLLLLSEVFENHKLNFHILNDDIFPEHNLFTP